MQTDSMLFPYVMPAYARSRPPPPPSRPTCPSHPAYPTQPPIQDPTHTLYGPALRTSQQQKISSKCTNGVFP